MWAEVALCGLKFMPKTKKTKRIMISLPEEMLELLDFLQKDMMYPTRSAVIQEGIRRIATTAEAEVRDKNSKKQEGEVTAKNSEEQVEVQ